MAETLDRSERSTPDKQALLGKLLQRKGKQLNIFPASYAQQRMWLLDQMASSVMTYTIPSGLRISGKLDRQALTQAIAAGQVTPESLVQAGIQSNLVSSNTLNDRGYLNVVEVQFREIVQDFVISSSEVSD